MKLPDPKSGGFTPTPAGQHNAVCTRFIDLGTQTTQSQWGTKRQRKVMIAWEIPSIRVEWMKDDQKYEGPALHYERFTFSTHEKAELRNKLEMWRGKPFSESDFGDGPDAFDVRNLIGVGALLQIAHKAEGGKTYANLQAIMLPPGGKSAWVKPEGQTMYLALTPDEFDAQVYESLSDRLRETIASSPEYQAMFPSSFSDGGGNPENGNNGGFDDMDDEIPF
jgi:hypothetical protein